jgi:hypothetical protein
MSPAWIRRLSRKTDVTGEGRARLRQAPASPPGEGSGAGPIQEDGADNTRWPNVRSSLKLHLSGIVALSANPVYQGPREKTGLFEFTAKTSDEEGLVELGLRLEKQFSTFSNSFSIIAVHGLQGDAYETWADGSKIWLRDFLPSQVPSARIMSYGYDSIVAFSKSISGIDEFAADLLARVCCKRNSAQVTSSLPRRQAD